MEQAEITVKEKVPDMLTPAQGMFIEFQLPAILCCVKLEVVSILTKAVLVERVNQMLASLPRLIMPGSAKKTNWKLSNYQGNVINVQNWDAMQHAGSTIMVSFDHEFVDGEVRPTPGHLHQLHNHFILKNSETTKDPIIQISQSNHLLVAVRVYRLNMKRTWCYSYYRVVAIAYGSKLKALGKALESQYDVQFRAPPWAEAGVSDYVYYTGEQKIDDIVKKSDITVLDMLAR